MAGRVHPRDLGKDDYTWDGKNVFRPVGGERPVADSKITRKEDANLKAYQELRLGQLSLDEPSIPNRPSYGDKGARVTLWTNNMEVSMDSDQQIFTYEIVIDNRLVIRRKRQYFMESALRQIPELRALGSGIATDYASLIVTSVRLDPGPGSYKTFTLDYYDTEIPEGRVRAPAGKPFKLQISLTGSLSASDFLGFTDPASVNSDHSNTADTEAIRALNVIIASHPNKDPNVYRVGRNKFFKYPPQKVFNNYELTGGLIAVRGYFSSARFSTSRILLNLNSQCSPFYKTMNAWELVHEFQESTPGDWLALHHFLFRLRVKTSYTKAPNGTPLSHIWSITGFSHKKLQSDGTDEASRDSEFNHGNANEIRFKLKGRQPEVTMSVKEYFLQEHGVTLKHPEAIVLKFGTKDDPIWIPAELCTVMPGQPYGRKLNGNQTTRMLTIAARPPAENASRIMAEDGGLGLIGVLPEVSENLLITYLKSAFGIKVNASMIVVPGRVLSSPGVTYSGKVKAQSSQSKGGASWNMKDFKFVRAATIPPWAMLRIGAASKIPTDRLEKQYNALTTSFKLCGLQNEEAKFRPTSGPLITELKRPDDKPDMKMNKSFVNAELRSTLSKCKLNGVSMLVVILPSGDSWLYDRIKYFGDVVYGVQTVCHLMDRFSKEDPMTSANIALKMNLKSGGANHVLSPGDLGFLEQGKTMLVGIDVTHPSGSMKGTPSIAGVVASIDSQFSQFPGSIRCQESRKEMVTDLDEMMEERLKLWISKNTDQKLESIIVYRDGVSEGQYKIVLREEIPAIRKACAKVFGNTIQPEISFIIVGKNHHNRFYPTDKKTANTRRNCNVNSGTVVDRGITMTQGWDFFLVAHEPLSGTAKPAHYTVLLDEGKESRKLDANRLEKITHNLCYLQGRATKAVSICPPAYYAHLICLRARCYISNYVNHDWPADKEYDENESPWHSAGVHENLKDTMFYI